MISKSQISFVKSLHQKKYRLEYRLFLAEGLKVVTELLVSGFGVKSIYMLEHLVDGFQKRNANVLKNTEIVPASAQDMERMSAMSTAPEVLAVFHMLPSDINDFVQEDILSRELVLCLDEVRDPGNMGTIIRIADWFGIRRIVCAEHSVEIYNPKTVQSTMGSLGRVQVYYTELVSFFESQAGIPVYGALLEGKNIYSESLTGHGIILMGSESHGISEGLNTFITNPLTIPSFGRAESLNVAVATGIICSEFKRRG